MKNINYCSLSIIALASMLLTGNVTSVQVESESEIVNPPLTVSSEGNVFIDSHFKISNLDQHYKDGILSGVKMDNMECKELF